MIKPGQDDAGEEGLAGAGGAKDAGRALDEFVQVDADRMSLFAGVTDGEIGLLRRVAEDLGDVTAGSQLDRGMVRRHGLDRQGMRRVVGMLSGPGSISRVVRLRPALEHQGRQDLQGRVKRLSMQGLRQARRQAGLGLLVGEARVGGAELKVGHQAIELPIPAGDDHEGAFLYFLRRDGQAGPEGILSARHRQYTQLVSSYLSFFHHKGNKGTQRIFK